MNKIEYYKSFVKPQDASRHYTCITNYNLKIDGFLPSIPLAPISVLEPLPSSLPFDLVDDNGYKSCSGYKPMQFT